MSVHDALFHLAQDVGLRVDEFAFLLATAAALILGIKDFVMHLKPRGTRDATASYGARTTGIKPRPQP